MRGERGRQRGACKERNEVMKKNYGGNWGTERGEGKRGRERGAAGVTEKRKEGRERTRLVKKCNEGIQVLENKRQKHVRMKEIK